MDKKFKDNLYALLKNDSRLWSEDGKELNQTLLKDLVDKFDEKVIESLLNNTETKKQFFAKIKDAYIFKPNDFKFFLDENKIDNSYTQYANKIGLNLDNGNGSGDVVLEWPYKDCVLLGGMKKEDAMDTYFVYDGKSGEWKEQKAKRKEIFFNKILARDEVDRLEEPKAFYKWEKFTAKGGEKVKEIRRDENGLIKENLVIKGNNLLVLHSLKEQFEGKIKLIYIDPPYNRDADTFYNDNFKHSTWLTFMKNRLEIANELLSNDGAIFIQCDDNEQSYLKAICDEIFGINQFMTTISVKMSEASGVKMAHAKKRLPKLKEYILVYKKPDFKIIENDLVPIEKWNNEYKTFLDNFSKEDRDRLSEIQEKEINSEEDILVANGLLKNVKLVSLSEKQKELKLKENDFDKWKFNNAWRIVQSVGSESVKKQVLKLTNIPKQELASFLTPKKLIYLFKTDFNQDTKDPRIQVLFADDNLLSNPGDFWQDIKTTGGVGIEGGVILPGGKKPESLLKRIISISTRDGDIVLDYHAGSGTTCAVAHKMNRQWIGVEQLDYSDNNPEARMKGVIEGDKTGISKEVNWKGGGDFIFTKLVEWNQEAEKKILTVESYTELVKLFDELYERYFLNYNVRVKDFRETIIKESEFKNLDLVNQKKMFVRMLDLNQMYVNFSERNDKKYNLAKEDIALSEEFYKQK
jgi:adenine-specific DNA-methyltransferase